MIRILLVGACGRMGRQIAAHADQMDAKIAAGVDVHPDAAMPFPVYPAFSFVKEPADVLVDFSRAEGLDAVLTYALANKLPVLLAATGYNENDLERIHGAAVSIPVFRSANMSLGVQALKELCAKAAAMLREFDIEIVEKHHNQKLDAPSGTALMLLDAVKGEESQPVFGRYGRTQRRDVKEIGVHAVRGGTLAGEHEVGFYGQGESLLLTHIAQDRSVFAAGALRAAHFLVDQAPGLYDMGDLTRALLG